MKLHPLPPYQLSYQLRTLDLSVPQVMGILNVTPDSFSDGGQYTQLDSALFRVEQMLAEGATIIDIGGESTRPNALPVSEAEELERVVDVVAAISQRFGEQVWLSVDTSTPAVIQAASAVGAHIWNDVRSLSREGAVAMAAALEIPVMLMHMRGEPATMNQLAVYDNVINEVLTELGQRIDAVVAGGVKRDKLIVDVGFGFAKDHAHNLYWLDNLTALHQLGLPVMIGISRKRTLAQIVKQSLPANIDATTEMTQKDALSMAAALMAIQQGACIVRTHHVAMTKAAIHLWQAMNTGELP